MHKEPILGSLCSSFSTPIIVMGDFNTIKNIEDRFNKLGNVVSGQEKASWIALRDKFELLVMGYLGDYSWQTTQVTI